MASPPDRDKDTNNSQPKNDNPFIKFRQFADSQISSLLQGIVGLPSAFSKRPDNAPWDDFDEYVRQRDDAQKRQKGLRDLEARKQNEGQGGQGGQGWPSWVDSASEISPEIEQMDDRIAREIPLYSPVSRSLFAHLPHSKQDTGPKDDWKPIDEQRPHAVSLLSSIHNIPYRFRNYAEHMCALQATAYRDLQNNPFLRSDYSLLPYMLFSPYSPIKLDSERHFRNLSGHQKPDHFAYLEAFSDLMLITQGRRMGSVPFENMEKIPNIDPERGYILTLWAHGVLQQRSTTKYPDVIAFQRQMTGDLRRWAATVVLNPQDSEDAETELEAYDRFLVRAFQTFDGDPIESYFTHFHDWLKQRLASFDPAEMKRQLEELTEFLEQKLADEEQDERRAAGLKVLGSLLNEAAGEGERTPDQRKRVAESFSETKIAKELKEAKRKAAADPNKVISSSTTTERTEEDGVVATRIEVWKEYAEGEDVEATCTTTEHVTKEDGTVESKVEVWKRHADGRETTTTTRHVEDHSYGYDDDNDDDDSNDGRHNGINSKDTDAQKEENKQGKNTGWFWN